MTQAFVAIGSNVDPTLHLRQAASALRREFPTARFSPCYRNAAFGFQGADFLNAVVGFETQLSITALLAALRRIEFECGRGPQDPKWGPRAIDLDLLLYDAVVGSGAGYVLPRPDLTRRAYMLGPLAQLAPEFPYPPAGPTIAQLWQSYPQHEAALQRTGLDLNAPDASAAG